MKIAIGCDHGGYSLKEKLKAHLLERKLEVIDCGTNNPDRVDYPDYAEKVGKMVASGEVERGVLICGTGIGMSIAANKVKGVRAALCGDCYSAQKAREHNDANIICMGERVTGPGLAEQILDTYLDNKFLGSYHTARVEKIMKIEQEK